MDAVSQQHLSKGTSKIIKGKTRPMMYRACEVRVGNGHSLQVHSDSKANQSGKFLKEASIKMSVSGIMGLIGNDEEEGRLKVLVVWPRLKVLVLNC